MKGFEMSGNTETRSDRASEPRLKRGFGVSDAMAVVAGAAVATWGGSKPFAILLEQATLLCRTILSYNTPRYARVPGLWRHQAESHWSTALWYAVQVLEVLVLSLTLSFLLMRLRPPRPPLRDMVRQPGTVAGLAVTFGYFWVTGWLHVLFFGRIIDQCALAVSVGGTVAVSWLFLMVSRLWTAEPSWVDRLGRLIGALAIAVALLAFTQFGI
jgi:hypothetical protein